MYMNCFLPLQRVCLTSFPASLSSAYSTQPHWCSCFFFSSVPNSLPPHSWSPYWRLPLPGISFPLLFACLLSSLIQMCSHVTFWENLLWRPYLLKHTCFSPFTIILAVHIFLQLISIWYGHIYFFDLLSAFPNRMYTSWSRVLNLWCIAYCQSLE